jgi:hypothetical protein
MSSVDETILEHPRPFYECPTQPSSVPINESKTSQSLTPTVPVKQRARSNNISERGITSRSNHRSPRGKRCLGCGTRGTLGRVWINPLQPNLEGINTYIICRNPECPAGRITQPRLPAQDRLAWFILETSCGCYYIKIIKINLNKHNATAQLSAIRPTHADGIFLGTLHQNEHKCTPPDSDDSDTDTDDELS